LDVKVAEELESVSLTSEDDVGMLNGLEAPEESSESDGL
jgi:hypothetical protein